MNLENRKSGLSPHQVTFVLAKGPFPHPCYFCGKVVEGYTRPANSLSAAIHHLDGDRSNNSIENLVAVHNGCHARYHSSNRKRRPHSDEAKAKISANLRQAYLEGRLQLPSRLGVSSPQQWIACCMLCKRELRPQDLPRHICFGGQSPSKKPRKPFSSKHRKHLGESHRKAWAEGRKEFSTEARSNIGNAAKKMWQEGWYYSSCIKCQKLVSKTWLSRHLQTCNPDN